MNTFADRYYANDLHVPKIRFGGDVALKPGTERLAKKISERGKDNREWYQPDAPKGGSGSLKRHPGKGPREKRSGCHVGSTALMDGESAFACTESGHRFIRGRLNILHINIPKQKKACRVGMASHGGFVRARKNVKCGVFERMITPGFENKREV
jgi:hypothetical protein